MEKMKKTAIENIEKLISKLGLNPNVKKYFEEGKVYYSYLTAGGWLGSIDNIEYDERYPKIIAECEKQSNCLVYHAIESGNILCLLFVTRKYANRPIGKTIVEYVYNLKSPEMPDCREIQLEVIHGALTIV